MAQIHHSSIFRSQHYSQAQAAFLWSNPSPNRANVAATGGWLGPCSGKSRWSPRMEILHHLRPCAVTLLSSPKITLSLSQVSAIYSQNPGQQKPGGYLGPVLACGLCLPNKISPIVHWFLPSDVCKYLFQSSQWDWNGETFHYHCQWINVFCSSASFS